MIRQAGMRYVAGAPFSAAVKLMRLARILLNPGHINILEITRPNIFYQYGIWSGSLA